MHVGIVGTSHLTEDEKMKAYVLIETLVERARQNGDTIVTGDAEGVDNCVRILAQGKLKLIVYAAVVKEWNNPNGFKARNISIANKSDYLYSISTKIKEEACYHCDIANHERTGGCWVLRFVIDKLKKKGELIILK